MAGPVPVARSLADIYNRDALPTEAVRWNRLLEAFQSRYGQPARFVARSPGRVNIIGEHIDYSLYSVLPMAITADVLIAVSTNLDCERKDGTYCIELANMRDEKFPAKTFNMASNADVDIDATVHEWTNYFQSGLRGALEFLRKKRGGGVKPRSMRVLMDGTVPVGGGLSSSAAFTSASVLAVMYANGEMTIDKTELTELAIVSERAVGVNSGGMDQSASVFSERGSALFVSFTPSLQARTVQIPKTKPELAFVIAQSFVQADKHVTGPIHYNLRVVECSLAAAYLNAALNPQGTLLPSDAGPLGISLRGFHDVYFSRPDHKDVTELEKQLEELIAVTETTLSQTHGYTREEVAQTLGMSVDKLNARFTSRFPVRAKRFLLRQRALHVFSEAHRVLRFMALLEDEDPGPGDTTAYNHRLGALLNETQDSCRDVYQCSCPETDRLCKIARSAGSYGSRLTGAGWGGCSVHLVPVDKVEAVRVAWEKEYYSGLNLSEEERAAAVVVSSPGGGSALYEVEEGRVGGVLAGP